MFCVVFTVSFRQAAVRDFRPSVNSVLSEVRRAAESREILGAGPQQANHFTIFGSDANLWVAALRT